MTNRPLAVLALAIALAAVPAIAHAAGVADWTGHLAFGYAKLGREVGTPGGSLSMGAGVARPVAPALSVGASMGYHLLGSKNFIEGSLAATVDYSAFDAELMAHWQPAGWGPVGRVSAGPGLMHARADLSSAGGGAVFADRAVSRTAPAAALDVTFISRRPRPVRVGLEGFLRVGFVPDDTWILGGARVAFHY